MHPADHRRNNRTRARPPRGVHILRRGRAAARRIPVRSDRGLRVTVFDLDGNDTAAINDIATSLGIAD
jgi:hypothetical protein